jgi:hypothetical protein
MPDIGMAAHLTGAVFQTRTAPDVQNKKDQI